MKNNRWKELWDKRTADFSKIESGNFEEVFLELKRSDGLDVFPGKMGYESFVYQLEAMWEELTFPNRKLESVFEVGCGGGAQFIVACQE